MLEKLQDARKRYLELEKSLADPAVIADQVRFQSYAKEHSELAPIVEKFRKYDQVVKEINEAQELIEVENDAEFIELAQEELTTEREKDSVGARLKVYAHSEGSQ